MQINWFVGDGMVLYTLVRRRVPVEGAICKYTGLLVKVWSCILWYVGECL